MAAPLQTVVKIHYLPAHSSVRDRVQELNRRERYEPAGRPRGALRGSTAYRTLSDAEFSRERRRYYRLLQLAHEFVELSLECAPMP